MSMVLCHLFLRQPNHFYPLGLYYTICLGTLIPSDNMQLSS